MNEQALQWHAHFIMLMGTIVEERASAAPLFACINRKCVYVK